MIACCVFHSSKKIKFVEQNEIICNLEEWCYQMCFHLMEPYMSNQSKILLRFLNIVVCFMGEASLTRFTFSIICEHLKCWQMKRYSWKINYYTDFSSSVSVSHCCWLEAGTSRSQFFQICQRLLRHQQLLVDHFMKIEQFKFWNESFLACCKSLK